MVVVVMLVVVVVVAVVVTAVAVAVLLADNVEDAKRGEGDVHGEEHCRNCPPLGELIHDVAPLEAAGNAFIQ
eukprot:5487350-Prorocentrum_lima.AAC.1